MPCESLKRLHGLRVGQLVESVERTDDAKGSGHGQPK
jgi:hypothetical protein